MAHKGKQFLEKTELPGGCFLKGTLNFTCPGGSLLVGLETTFDPYSARKTKGRFDFYDRSFRLVCGYLKSKSSDNEFSLKSLGVGKYGRCIGEVYLTKNYIRSEKYHGKFINKMLVKEGHAIPYED